MERILIVDDNVEITKAIKIRLEAENYDVLIACNGKEALDILAEESLDLVILDVLMPDMDGFEVCRRLKSGGERVHPPIIMLTVLAKDTEKVKGLDVGAHDYITKPYESDELLARVRAGLRAKREYDRVLKMAERDPLTGLYNRRSLNQRLREEFARAERYDREFSIIMMDIDNFKMVNDTYGHQTGDLVLAQVSDLIAKSLRKGDIPHRYGGEEFLIIATETGIAGAKKCAERIRLSCEKGSFGKEKQAISMKISAGIACYPRETVSTPEELLREADSALYKAKAAGGNCISVIGD